MANLEIGIGADSSGFDKEILKVEKQLEKLKSQQAANIKLGLDTSGIEKQISDTTSKLNGLQSSLKSSTTAFNNNSKATANGSSTLTQFSRIAQDAPFGIIGIGNNLTATAESFGYLAKSSGGAINAFKAIGASLMGSGGLILAFSAVTSGLTYMAQEGLTVSDVFNKLTGNFSGFAVELKKASEEATKSAIEETGALKGLIAIAQSEAQSKKMRLEAVDQLQKMYPNYFGNLSKEEIMYGDLTGVINDVTKALINKAIAEKLSAAAAEPTMKLWEANARLVKQKEELLKAEQKIESAVKSGSSAQAMATYSNELNRAKNNLQETRREVIALNKEVASYEKGIRMASEAGAKVILKPGASAKPQKAQKQWSERNVGAMPQMQAADVVGLDDNQYKIAKDRIGRDGQLIQSYAKAGEFVKATLGVQKQGISEEMMATLLILENFNNDASYLINTSITDTFGQLGTAIGEALATGGNVLSAIGTTILQGLGKFLSEMGGLLIQYGTMAVVKGKLDVAIAAGGPIAIGAGIAAIGVGIALKAIGGAIASKAKGGVASGTTSSTGGNYDTGASVSTPTSSVSGGGSYNSSGGTVVFEISGQKLIGVLSNTLGANQRLGGSLAIG